MNHGTRFFASVVALPMSVLSVGLLVASESFGSTITDLSLLNLLITAFGVMALFSMRLAFLFYKKLRLENVEIEKALLNKDILINRQREWIDRLEVEVQTSNKAEESNVEKDLMLKVYEQMAQNVPQVVMIMDRDGAINWVNKSFEHVTGYSSVEVIGRKPESFLRSGFRRPESGADDYSLTEAVYNYTKNGRGYWSSQSISPVYNEQGEVEKFIVIESEIGVEDDNVQDVENQIQRMWEDQYAKSIELEKREEELAEALELCEKIKKDVQDLWMMSEQLDSGVIITDRNGKVEWVNEGFEKVFGCKFGEVAGMMPKFTNPVLSSLE